MGVSGVIARVRGNRHTDTSVCLGFSIHLSIARDADGDASVLWGEVVGLEPVCGHMGGCCRWHDCKGAASVSDARCIF